MGLVACKELSVAVTTLRTRDVVVNPDGTLRHLFEPARHAPTMSSYENFMGRPLNVGGWRGIVYVSNIISYSYYGTVESKNMRTTS
jgi:hypothetical protein